MTDIELYKHKRIRAVNSEEAVKIDQLYADDCVLIASTEQNMQHSENNFKFVTTFVSPSVSNRLKLQISQCLENLIKTKHHS